MSREFLMRALEAPIRAIVTNSGESPDRVVAELQARKNTPWHGFNAMTNKMADLKEAGIIDPLKVTKMAFVNALSVAANYLTIGAAVTNVPEKKSGGSARHGRRNAGRHDGRGGLLTRRAQFVS
jgi:chaperonin GroEL